MNQLRSSKTTTYSYRRKMSIINTTIIDNQFVFIGSHIAIQTNLAFLVLKMPHQLNSPKAIQVLLH